MSHKAVVETEFGSGIQLSNNVEEAFMPFVDLPSLALLEPVYLVAQAPVGAAPVSKPDRVVGVCHLAMNPPVPPKTAVNSISPLFSAKDYLTKWEKVKVEDEGRTSVLKQPDHGILVDGGGGNYYFEPEAGYLGKDQATILVEVAGMKIHMKYFFQVLTSLPDDYDRKRYCPERSKWRISLDDSGIGLAANISVDLKIADLPSDQLGLAKDGILTLDSTAAGHGWFIDPTAGDNAESLPTSNPNEWVAKEGSAASGKMDNALMAIVFARY